VLIPEFRNILINVASSVHILPFTLTVLMPDGISNSSFAPGNKTMLVDKMGPGCVAGDWDTDH